MGLPQQFWDNIMSTGALIIFRHSPFLGGSAYVHILILDFPPRREPGLRSFLCLTEWGRIFLIESSRGRAACKRYLTSVRDHFWRQNREITGAPFSRAHLHFILNRLWFDYFFILIYSTQAGKHAIIWCANTQKILHRWSIHAKSQVKAFL